LRPAGQIVREILSQKYPTQRRDGGVTQVVKFLPSKCEAPEFKSQYNNNNKNYCAK
jgi:hypothetical protein